MASSGCSKTKRIFLFKNQNYEELKLQHLREKRPFSDSIFPANADSIQLSDSKNPDSKYLDPQWSRPKDICKPLAPQFIREGMTLSDVRQGHLGDCWILAAAASLTTHPKLLEWVVPRDQSFGLKDYAGIFHFRFWQFGQWVDVVVDDQLPCKSPTELLFGSSREKNEFWMPLLEKAFAKLNDSYGNVVGGSMRNALVYLTGGIGETINLRKPGICSDFWETIRKAVDTKALMGASILKNEDQSSDAINELKRGHAYSIIEFKKLTVKGVKIELVRLRNPWGYKEWDGAWSDNDKQNWSKVDPEQKKNLLVEEDNGEFWMSLCDFQTIFDNLHICYLSEEAPKEEATSFRWHSSCFQGHWKKAKSDKPSETLWTNPQFYFLLRESDRDGSIYTIISLTQRYKCRSKNENKCQDIGFVVYKVTKEYPKLKDPDQRKKVLSDRRPEKQIHGMVEECTRHLELPPGHYVIIPWVQPPREDVFLLRIFTEKKHESLDISLD